MKLVCRTAWRETNNLTPPTVRDEHGAGGIDNGTPEAFEVGIHIRRGRVGRERGSVTQACYLASITDQTDLEQFGDDNEGRTECDAGDLRERARHQSRTWQALPPAWGEQFHTACCCVAALHLVGCVGSVDPPPRVRAAA